MKYFLKAILFFFLLFSASQSSYSQVIEPCKWSYNVSSKNVKIGDEIELAFNVEIDKGWHLYSSDFDPNCGPMVTVFKFEKNNTYELIGEVKPIGATKHYDDVFECDYTSFDENAKFVQKIKILSENVSVNASYEYQVCTDEGKCIVFDDTYTFEISATKTVETLKTSTNEQNSEIIKEEKENVPANDTIQNTDTTTIIKNEKIEESNTINNSFLTPFKNLEKFTDNNVASLFNNVSDKNEFYEAEQFLNGLENKSNFKNSSIVKSAVRKKANELNISIPGWAESLWGIAILAFLSGLIALLTPCVFPMIPMTVTFFMHSGKSKSEGIQKALFYGISIISIYTIIGVLVSVTMGPEFANWLSTHWAPNVFFFIIFLIFAASFLGMFEITLPSSWVNKMDQNADKGGFAGAFFMAFTLVLVSFSCTGPIVGTILVEAAGGQFLKPTIGMAAFGAAFAIPFTLFAIFPGWLSNLPKSGGWLNSVKVVLGFLEIALGLKFLSVADQTYHWGLLDREIYIAIWIAVFTLLGVYLIGKIRLPHDSPLEKISVPRLAFAIIVFSFVVYLIPGMFGAPLKALSGYLPPQTSLDFDLSKSNNNTQSTNSIDATTLCDTPKYNDFLHLPHGLKGYFDLNQALKCANEQNKPLFIDFTGHGCVNCREMEANVWSDPEVSNILKNEFIIVALYCDDKKELPENMWYTSTFDNKIKKTLGKQNADYQITKFESNSQPLYVIMGLEEESLTKPHSYDLNISNFISFLKQGKANFEKKYK